MDRARLTFAAVAAITGVLLFRTPASAGLISPSDSNLVPFEITQGDFTTVSLDWANTVIGGKGQGAYYVSSSPGQLHNYVVPYTGSSGLSPNGAGIEAPYIASTGGTSTTKSPFSSSGDYYFRTGLTATGGAGCTPNCIPNPDPGPDPTGGTVQTWDASISALNAKLNGGDAVFYFNMNETGKTDTLSGIDLLLWAKITLVDTTPGGLAPMSFILANDKTQPAPDPTVATCDVNPVTPYSGNASCGGTNANGTAYHNNPTNGNADPAWTYVSGFFCIKSDGTLAHYGHCTNTDPKTDQSVENNLGANQAAFAAWNTQLDTIIANNGCVTGGCYDVLQADFRLSMLDNGYEQVFIASTASPQVPEPSSLSLLGMGLLAMVGVRRWRRHN